MRILNKRIGNTILRQGHHVLLSVTWDSLNQSNIFIDIMIYIKWIKKSNKHTTWPANEILTYGSTRSLLSPVNAFFTLAISPVFILGNPWALCIRMMYLARDLSEETPSGRSRFLLKKDKNKNALILYIIYIYTFYKCSNDFGIHIIYSYYTSV